MSIRKGYSDGPEGQVHWRMAHPVNEAKNIDLYCFSPAPFGSIAFEEILPHLARNRRVVAPDYPGQAGSEGGSPTPSIESYARSMVSVIKDLSGDRPVGLIGFHSGCLVAAEVKLQASDQVDHMVLIDVPAFDPETRAKYLPSVGGVFNPTAEIDALAKAWEMAVTKRLAHQSIDQCYEMFAEMAGNGARMNATFHAAFTFDVEAKLNALSGPVTILATRSSLLEWSRRAADLIQGANMVEILDIEGSVLNANAKRTAEAVLAHR